MASPDDKPPSYDETLEKDVAHETFLVIDNGFPLGFPLQASYITDPIQSSHIKFAWLQNDPSNAARGSATNVVSLDDLMEEEVTIPISE